MQNDGTTYKTLKEAHNAICLDAGFDPFLHGGLVHGGMQAVKGGPFYRRLTLAAARALGYPVAEKPYRSREAARRCLADRA
jgi:hypothetical protein